MEKLVIITPKDGLFAKNLSLSCKYQKTSATADFVHFIYIGDFTPLQKALQILSSHNFYDFSLDKETPYLRLKVRVE